MRVALVYDRVNKWGGAERVLLALHQLFPDAPLYTSVYNPISAPWAKSFDIKTSFLQNFPYATLRHDLYPVLMPVAFESFSFDEYNLVISVTSEAAKGIITKPNTVHICYCLTPTRYLWSGYNEYFKNPGLKFLATPAVSYLRKWDTTASYRPDFFIAISQEVKKRIQLFYDKDAEVIYPPKTLINTLPKDTDYKGKKEYFLVVSRLIPYKRIDIAIDACNRLQVSLKIVGTGSEEMKLKAKAGKTIEFLGNLTDDELIRYYKNCKALLFPGFEDFGLTIIEAQQYGRPVLAYKAGGALETIIEGKTGLFFKEQTVEALVGIIKEFETKSFHPVDSLTHAEKFSFENFKQKFMKFVNNHI